MSKAVEILRLGNRLKNGLVQFSHHAGRCCETTCQAFECFPVFVPLSVGFKQKLDAVFHLLLNGA